MREPLTFTTLPEEERQLIRSMHDMISDMQKRMEMIELNSKPAGSHPLSYYLDKKNFPVSRYIFNDLKAQGKAPQCHNGKYKDVEMIEFMLQHPNYIAPEFRKNQPS